MAITYPSAMHHHQNEVTLICLLLAGRIRRHVLLQRPHLTPSTLPDRAERGAQVIAMPRIVPTYQKVEVAAQAFLRHLATNIALPASMLPTHLPTPRVVLTPAVMPTILTILMATHGIEALPAHLTNSLHHHQHLTRQPMGIPAAIRLLQMGISTMRPGTLIRGGSVAGTSHDL